MEGQEFFKNYRDSLIFPDEKYGKSTLFFSEQILVGLNCFLPGQKLDKHAHENQSRFYLVLEGGGTVRVGEVEKTVAPGDVVWVPPRHAHRVANTGAGNLVMLAGISPSKCD
jgi:mannose-6-phosphate isomerase-like protein (cupin superfamily)